MWAHQDREALSFKKTDISDWIIKKLWNSIHLGPKEALRFHFQWVPGLVGWWRWWKAQNMLWSASSDGPWLRLVQTWHPCFQSSHLPERQCPELKGQDLHVQHMLPELSKNQAAFYYNIEWPWCHSMNKSDIIEMEIQHFEDFQDVLYQKTTFCIARLIHKVYIWEQLIFTAHSEKGSVLVGTCLEDLFLWVTGATKNVKESIILNPSLCNPSVLCVEQPLRQHLYPLQKVTGFGYRERPRWCLFNDGLFWPNADSMWAQEKKAASSGTHHPDCAVAEQSCKGPVLPDIPGTNGEALEIKQWTKDCRTSVSCSSESGDLCMRKLTFPPTGYQFNLENLLLFKNILRCQGLDVIISLEPGKEKTCLRAHARKAAPTVLRSLEPPRVLPRGTWVLLLLMEGKEGSHCVDYFRSLKLGWV